MSVLNKIVGAATFRRMVEIGYKTVYEFTRRHYRNSQNKKLPSHAINQQGESEPDQLRNNDINLFYYPDYTENNPYQQVLYYHLANNGISVIALSLKDLLKRMGEDEAIETRVVFHQHWTDAILSSAQSREEAVLQCNQYLKCLDAYLGKGGKFIWTIHSVLSQGCKYRGVEIELHHGMAKRAHVIHVDSEELIKQINKTYSLPQDKIEILPQRKWEKPCYNTYNSTNEYGWNKVRHHLTLVIDTLFKDSYSSDQGSIAEISTEQQLVKCRIRSGDSPKRNSARVAIVILNYEYFADTVQAIRSIDKSTFTDYHIYIVDNSLAKRSFQAFVNLFPNYTVIKTERNMGYAGGNNVALKLIEEKIHEYIWILNPDMIVPSHTMGELVTIAENNPDVGIIGSKIYYGMTKEIIWFAGGIIEWDDGFVTKHLGMGKPDDPTLQDSYSVDYVTGASIFMRRHVLDDVGLFPEDYFLYFEDADWCMQAEHKSIVIKMFPTTYLFHRERSKTDGLPKPYFLYYFIRNRLIMCKKYQPSKLKQTKENLHIFIDSMIKGIEQTDKTYLTIARKLTDKAVEDGLTDVKGWRDLQSLID